MFISVVYIYDDETVAGKAYLINVVQRHCNVWSWCALVSPAVSRYTKPSDASNLPHQCCL